MDAFIDESWSTNKVRDHYFLVVVSVMTTDRRKIELAVRRLKRVPKLKASSELKASASSEKVAVKFLRALADDPNITVLAAIWEGKKTTVHDNEALYQTLVARCAFQSVKQSHRVVLHLDKRYTRQNRQRELESKIRESIAGIPGNIVQILQEDSRKVEALAAADFIAWAYTQRYCHANDKFYNLIRAKVKHFDDLSQ